MFRIIVALILGIGLISCSDENTPIVDPAIPGSTEPPIEEQGNQEDLQEDMINLGFKTFLQINSDSEDDENILISPLSIETALYMAANGAEEETLSEIRTALEMGDFYPNGINENYQQLIAAINADGSDKTFLTSAQAAFYNPSLFDIDETFQSNLENFYDAEVHDDKFNLESINGWANEKTNGRIPKVLDNIREDEFMFVMNALYFLGDWDVPFAEESTRDANFNFIDGRRPTVRMMNNDTSLPHYIGNDLSAVDLLFADEKFSMTFIRPDADINTFLAGHDFNSFAARYNELVNDQIQSERLDLFLPKFEIKYKRELSTDLKEMGMPRAFDMSSAQFKKVGMAGGNIYLSRVIHDTFLKIDEKGAEGAAVTTVGFGVESVPPTITFDKPFLVVIRHIESGIPIFIGKISDPLG